MPTNIISDYHTNLDYISCFRMNLTNVCIYHIKTFFFWMIWQIRKRKIYKGKSPGKAVCFSWTQLVHKLTVSLPHATPLCLNWTKAAFNTETQQCCVSWQVTAKQRLTNKILYINLIWSQLLRQHEHSPTKKRKVVVVLGFIFSGMCVVWKDWEYRL